MVDLMKPINWARVSPEVILKLNLKEDDQNEKERDLNHILHSFGEVPYFVSLLFLT
jgi:hypothetical protein